MPLTSMALMAQYLNFRQRKLGTIIIQTVHILQHESAATGLMSIAHGGLFQAQSKLLPINPALQ
jgi:hypothetical protein